MCVYTLSRVHTSTKEEDYLRVIDGLPAPLSARRRDVVKYISFELLSILNYIALIQLIWRQIFDIRAIKILLYCYLQNDHYFEENKCILYTIFT